MHFELPSETATLALGAELAQLVLPPCVVYLQGNLGAGKTTLVRGFMRALGIDNSVKSPTYTLIETYPLADRNIIHLDLYRLKQAAELIHLGLEDYYSETSIFLIEWPEQGFGYLPPADLVCELAIMRIQRHVTLRGMTDVGNDVLTLMMAHGVAERIANVKKTN